MQTVVICIMCNFPTTLPLSKVAADPKGSTDVIVPSVDSSYLVVMRRGEEIAKNLANTKEPQDDHIDAPPQDVSSNDFTSTFNLSWLCFLALQDMAVRKLVRAITHEMKTPLSTAIMALEMMKEELQDETTALDRTRLLVSCIEVSEASDICLAILDELQWNYVNIGKAELERKLQGVTSIVEEGVDGLREEALEKGIQLVLSIPPLDSSLLNSYLLHVDDRKVLEVSCPTELASISRCALLIAILCHCDTTWRDCLCLCLSCVVTANRC